MIERTVSTILGLLWRKLDDETKLRVSNNESNRLFFISFVKGLDNITRHKVIQEHKECNIVFLADKVAKKDIVTI